MVLEKDEYKIVDDGIWIPRKVLEECKNHYIEVVDKCNYNNILKSMYIGKTDVYVDLLKMFDDLEG